MHTAKEVRITTEPVFSVCYDKQIIIWFLHNNIIRGRSVDM